MNQSFSISEAKSKFSEIINRVIYKNERFIVTKKGKKVAMVIPLEEEHDEADEGLLKGRGALAEFDSEVDEMVNSIYEARKKEMGREVDL
jgi:prevent-host-death family protein